MTNVPTDRDSTAVDPPGAEMVVISPEIAVPAAVVADVHRANERAKALVAEVIELAEQVGTQLLPYVLRVEHEIGRGDADWDGLYERFDVETGWGELRYVMALAGAALCCAVDCPADFVQPMFVNEVEQAHRRWLLSQTIADDQRERLEFQQAGQAGTSSASDLEVRLRGIEADEVARRATSIALFGSEAGR